MAIVPAFVALAVTWLLWKTLRNWVVRSPLDNVPGPRSESVLSGVLLKILNVDGWAYHTYLYKTYGTTFRVPSFVGRKELFTYDPKAMHHILVKEQHIFEITDVIKKFALVLFGPGITATVGEQHRKQRKMLNPVFSVAHMREMIPTFYNVSYKLRDAFHAKVQHGPQEIEVLKWMTRTALELIGQSGLGFSFDALTDDIAPHPYSTAAKALVPALARPAMRYASGLILPSVSGLPALVKRWAVGVVPWEAAHELRHIVDVLHRTSVEIYESRLDALAKGDAGALADQVGQGKDIMSILMRANTTASKEESLTREELIAQVTTLTFAAMDTTSSALARVLHLLALHPDVQQKLREEIKDAKEKEGGDLPYNEIVSLPYLDAICRETLRLHAPVTMSRRVARQDAVIPLAHPIKGVDGKDMHEICVPKGTNVTIGLLASNVNPELWGPDADEWKPERWLAPLPDPLVAGRLPGVYSNLMTFLGGSRACIGFKFSQLEMKVVLLLLIESFRFSPSKAEIAWKMSTIVAPTIAGQDAAHSQLPLIVERVQ